MSAIHKAIEAVTAAQAGGMDTATLEHFHAKIRGAGIDQYQLHVIASEIEVAIRNLVSRPAHKQVQVQPPTPPDPSQCEAEDDPVIVGEAVAREPATVPKFVF
jgi:hypothetical protein